MRVLHDGVLLSLIIVLMLAGFLLKSTETLPPYAVEEGF